MITNETQKTELLSDSSAFYDNLINIHEGKSMQR